MQDNRLTAAYNRAKTLSIEGLGKLKIDIHPNTCHPETHCAPSAVLMLNKVTHNCRKVNFMTVKRRGVLINKTLDRRSKAVQGEDMGVGL